MIHLGGRCCGQVYTGFKKISNLLEFLLHCPFLLATQYVHSDAISDKIHLNNLLQNWNVLACIRVKLLMTKF